MRGEGRGLSHTHTQGRRAQYISGTKLDDRSVRVDFDAGFTDGRQFGRGASGGQVRDEFRQDHDTERGGWGTLKRGELYNRERGHLKRRRV